MTKSLRLFVIGCLLVLAGSVLAHMVQTTNGVVVQDVRYRDADGTWLSGLLYTPKTATAQHPAPAVLVSHGFINTREMQSPFAIELSRRGFVVLAMDMAGHGYSGGYVSTEAYGGPAALSYLSSLPFVDKTNIGLEGHSMGGAPVINAALAYPDGYKAVVLEGSTPGFLGGPGEGTTSFPHNLEVVMGQYDEFAPLMWQQARGSMVGISPRMKAIFGTPIAVVPGQLYGDLAAGTGRRLVNPPVDHPQEHFSNAGVGAAVDWFQMTLKGEASPMRSDNQIWFWKEIGTLTGFIGCVTLILGTFSLLIDSVFGLMNNPAEPVATRRDGRWWLAFGLTALIPAVTFYSFMKLGPVLFFAPFALTKTLPFALATFPEQITNQLVIWALLNGVISLVLSFLLRPSLKDMAKPAFIHRWVSAAVVAAISVAAGYIALALMQLLLQVDFRFWVLGLKAFDRRHLGIFLAYLPDFTVFFLLALRSFSLSLPVKGESLTASLVFGAAAMSLGFAALMAVQYIHMAMTGLLLTPDEPLNTIVAMQFVPILAVVGVIAAYTYRRTSDYAPGAFICALFVTWYIVAGTAVFSPTLKFPPAPAKAPVAAAAR
jgi:pimeloyl-ACP methyl ester carboxylesterase